MDITLTDRDVAVIDRALERLHHDTHFAHGDGHWTPEERNAQAAEIEALRGRLTAVPVG